MNIILAITKNHSHVDLTQFGYTEIWLLIKLLSSNDSKADEIQPNSPLPNSLSFQFKMFTHHKT